MSKALTTKRTNTVALAGTLAEQAKHYAQAAQAENTGRAYAAQWAKFEKWCTEAGRPALPAEPETVAQYLAGLAGAGAKFSTVGQARAAIADHHRRAGALDPVSHPVVRAVVAGIARTTGTAPKQKAPVSLDELRAMAGTCDTNTLAGLRDRALLLVGFWGAFRRSELVALDVDDCHLNGALKITVRRSKTDQTGEGQHKTLPALTDKTLCPVHALRAYLDGAEINSGAIFRRVDRWGHLHERMTDRAVALVVKACAKAAGLDARRLAGHSLRAGFVTAAIEAGAQALDVAEITGHRNQNTLGRYVRRAGRGGVRAIKLTAGEG